MAVPATVSGVLALEYQAADLSWVEVGRCDAGSILRTRRLALPPGISVTARKWRLVRRGSEDLGNAVFCIGRVAFWKETETLSAHRRWSFDFDTGVQRYGLIATEGNVEVYRRGTRVASIASPYNRFQIKDVRRAHSLDTLLGFHEEIAPHRFARQGAHTEWDSRPQPFENVPIFDYDGTRAGGINEVQQLQFSDMLGGDTFNLTLEGQTTASISYSTSMTALASSVYTSLTALENVGASGVSVSSPADKTLRVSYQANNRADDVGELAASVLFSEKGIVRTSTVTQGRPGGEPVISATRGWPAAGIFYGQRLWLAGLRSRPQTVLASRPGFYYDLNTRGGQSDKGIDVDLAADQSTPIMAMFAGPRLQVFSQSAEFFCASQPITPPPDFQGDTRAGLEASTPLFELDGGTVFVQGGGDTISRYVFTGTDAGSKVESLSDYASHITKGIIAGGMRRHRSTSEPNLLLYIRNDGTAVAMCALLKQEVLGFAPWTTDGAFTEAGGELAGDLYVCTRRGSANGDRHCLEVLSDTHMLDASVRVAGSCTEISGLGHLEGRIVCLYIDGADAGDVVVENGIAALPYPALRAAEAGLLFVPRGRILPLILTLDPRAGASMHARAGEVAFRLGPTANLKAGMTGKRMWPVSLKRRGAGGSAGALLDAGPGEDAFAGWARLFPIPGFQDDAQIDWVQERPGPLEIQEIVVTVQT